MQEKWILILILLWVYISKLRIIKENLNCEIKSSNYKLAILRKKNQNCDNISELWDLNSKLQDINAEFWGKKPELWDINAKFVR